MSKLRDAQSYYRQLHRSEAKKKEQERIEREKEKIREILGKKR